MNINEILKEKNMTKYRLAKLSGVPNATLSELCSGKMSIEKCSGETLYRISKALGVSMESLVKEAVLQKEVEKNLEKTYECALPQYLQHDLDEYKKGLKEGSTLMDCLWGELYGSINIAEINDAAITHDHAEYLRNKYLR